jgi:predicted NBD/HSP70 family sugar kinase
MPTGPGDVLALIRHGVADTRGDILETTGLSRMTISQRVDALFAAGLIVEGSTAGATGGRRRKRLMFNTNYGQVVAVAVDTTHARIAVTDLGGRVRTERRVETAIERGPSEVLDTIGRAVAALLHEDGLGRTDLCGLGVSLPGPVDPDSGRPSQPPIMPGWDAYPVAQHLEASLFTLPILTANDADAAAVGEYAHGFPGVRSLCLVKVSTGIGTGIVINGASYPGGDGGAGDIGHVRLASHPEALCQCGAHGCLAAVASGRAVAHELSELGYPVSAGHEVGDLLRAGNADAARLTQQAGRRIGEVMATVVCLLNPSVVLIGGDLASAPLLAGIRETLYRLSLPRATRHMTLQLGSLGEDATISGLTRLVVDQQFSPAAVNARLQ